jgi:hypothetical protein
MPPEELDFDLETVDNEQRKYYRHDKEYYFHAGKKWDATRGKWYEKIE